MHGAHTLELGVVGRRIGLAALKREQHGDYSIEQDCGWAAE